MANPNGSVPRSREQSIMDESIDFTEYEEQDVAVNKHLAAGRASGSTGNGASNTSSSGNLANGSSSSSSLSAAIISEEDAMHIQTIEQAMTRLRQLDADRVNEWEKVMSHARDVTVHVRKSVVSVSGKQKKVPLFRGDKFIQGFSPEQVFEVVGRRSLWDDWYDSGNLVADLNNSTSMTYLNMRVPGTARPRDLSLIERVEASSDGTIWFAATSIETSKVPHVHGRTRGRMVLNAWVLRPSERNGQLGTSCYYYLQIDPHGLTPFPLATKIVSKRLVHIYKIEDYLRKHGQPRSAGTGQTGRTPNEQSRAGGLHGTGSGIKDAASRADASGQEDGSSLPPNVGFDERHSSSPFVLRAKENMEQILASPGTWDKAVDSQGNPLYTQLVQGGSLPIMKGEAKMPSGVTAEQVLATILSTAACLIWNEHLQSTPILESINGLDQIIKKDTYKGIHPHLPSRTYTLAQGTFRLQSQSDDGDITCVSTSTTDPSNVGETSSSTNTLQSTIDYAGWQISSSSSSTSDQSKLISVIKINLDRKDMPEFVKRILVHAYAGAPARVGECIKKYGHAPYFLRWSAGKAMLQGETPAGDLKSGKIGWKITASGRNTEGETSEQIAWLQYSSTMYPNGITLQCIGTSEGITAAKVDGFPNTLQLTFSSNLVANDLVLQASRNSGSGPEDVSWNGQALKQSVSPPRGPGKIRRVPAKSPEKRAPIGEQSPPLVPENGNILQRNSLTSPVTQQQLAKVSEVATDLTTVHRLPVDPKGRRQLPDDAMLILTRDLYFTRSQMGLISVLLLLVWCAGRYS